MGRILALQNDREALSAFEAGECDLARMERRVRGVLRAYATKFAEQDAYRASGRSASTVPTRLSSAIVPSLFIE